MSKTLIIRTPYKNINLFFGGSNRLELSGTSGRLRQNVDFGIDCLDSRIDLTEYDNLNYV